MVVLLIIVFRYLNLQKEVIIKWGALLIGLLSMPLLYTTFTALF